jgi:hypothetical protein
MKEQTKIRPLNQQFSLTTIHRIRHLQNRFGALNLIAPGMKQCCYEIIMCLEAGLLLSALFPIPAILESSVRELLIRQRARSVQNKITDFCNFTENEHEKYYEQREYGFSKMLAELAKISLIDDEKAKEFTAFYEKIRIPLHHGIVGRLSSNLDDTGIDSLFGRLGRDHRIEYAIEDYGLELFEQCLGLLEHLDRLTEGIE